MRRVLFLFLLMTLPAGSKGWQDLKISELGGALETLRMLLSGREIPIAKFCYGHKIVEVFQFWNQGQGADYEALDFNPFDPQVGEDCQYDTPRSAISKVLQDAGVPASTLNEILPYANKPGGGPLAAEPHPAALTAPYPADLSPDLLPLPFPAGVPSGSNTPTPCDPSLGSSFFVSDHNASTVSRVYTCPGGRVAKQIQVGGRALAVEITPDAKLAISTSYDNEIDFIDTVTNTIVSRLRTSPDVHPAGLDITPDGTRAYVANLYDDGASVLVVDIATRSIVGNIPMPSFYPNMVRISPDGSMAAVSFQLSSDVYLIDTLTNTVGQRLSVSSPFDMVFNPTGTKLYVAGAGSGAVDVFDTTTWQKLTSIKVGPGPGTMGLTPDGNLLIVSNYVGGSISFIDLRQNLVVKTFNAGPNPIGPVFGR